MAEEFSQKMDGWNLRMDRIDDKFKELKQLILGLYPPSRKEDVINSQVVDTKLGEGPELRFNYEHEVKSSIINSNSMSIATPLSFNASPHPAIPQSHTPMRFTPLNPTHTTVCNTSPFTLTYHTTLSTGQPYYAIASTTPMIMPYSTSSTTAIPTNNQHIFIPPQTSSIFIPPDVRVGNKDLFEEDAKNIEVKTPPTGIGTTLEECSEIINSIEDLRSANQMFDKMSEKHFVETKGRDINPNVIPYTAMITEYVDAVKLDKGLNILEDGDTKKNEEENVAEEIKTDRNDDEVTMVSVMSACDHVRTLKEEDERLFEDMKKFENRKPHSWRYTIMWNFYRSRGVAEKAMEFFCGIIKCKYVTRTPYIDAYRDQGVFYMISSDRGKIETEKQFKLVQKIAMKLHLDRMKGIHSYLKRKTWRSCGEVGLDVFDLKGGFGWCRMHNFKLRECRGLEDGLSMYAFCHEILKHKHCQQVLVMIGENGSGKSTQLVQFRAGSGIDSTGSIIRIQPRKLAAMSSAQRVTEECYGCYQDTSIFYYPTFSSIQQCGSQITEYLDFVWVGLQQTMPLFGFAHIRTCSF